MRTVRSVIAFALLAGSVCAFSQQSQSKPSTGPAATAAPAAILLTDAKLRARAEGKNVLVIFHASWCGWCKRLDKFMADPQFKPVFDDNFVTLHLTVLEDDEHKKDENPGGLDQMAALGGKDAGLPMFAILDAEGKTLTNSMMSMNDKPQNTGFPAAKEEIEHFATMMQKGAAKILPEEIEMMKSYLAFQEAARKAAAAKKAASKKPS